MPLSTSFFLIGFSGSGKTTLGAIVARRMKIKFYDSDHLIEKIDGRSISSIFAVDGEHYFRKLEKQVLKGLLQKKSPKIIALGGGAFEAAENRRLVKKHGYTIYLSCSVNEIYKRINKQFERPLLKFTSKARENLYREDKIKLIKQLLEKRKKNYNQADIRFSTTGKTINVAVQELMEKLKNVADKS